MRRRTFQLGFLLTGLMVAVPNFAQQGHPLTGTWNGDWGISPSERTQVTLVMTWDGATVKGVINPGPDSSPTVVTVDVTKWAVRFEADLKDASGKPVHISADGQMDDIGNYHRTIEGIWRQGSVNGNFKLTRE